MLVDERTLSYAAQHCRVSEILEEIESFNKGRPDYRFQATRQQAAFLAFLAKLIDTSRILEVGVYTGYTSTAMAQAMQKGSLVAVDMNQEYLNIAEHFWQLAGVLERMNPVCMDGLEYMDKACELQMKFDLIYIDIERMAILPLMYEKALRLLSNKGVLAIDNVFWAGEVTSKSLDSTVSAIQEFNEYVYEDERVDMVMMPGLGDGLTLVRLA